METGDGDPTDQLRGVFDLCDVDRKGFITVDHFIELAKAHFTTDDAASQQVSLCGLIPLPGVGDCDRYRCGLKG